MTHETPYRAVVIPLYSAEVKQWDPSCLEGLAQELAGVEQLTETCFLELGGNIRELHSRAGEISIEAGNVLELLNGEGGETTLHRLQLLVERCNLWLNSTNEKSIVACGLLNEVLSQINELEWPVAGLRKVIKTLHSLRVSTRIEAAKGYASGASVLAKSLDQLGSMAQQKVAEIFTRTETLVPLIDRSIAMEDVAQAGSIKAASQEVSKARQLLGDFLDTCLETGKWTDRLKVRSESVSNSFGEIVAALQFQDITRQRLEHVQHALENLGEHLTHFTHRKDFRHDAEVERLFGCICKLQHEQLDYTASEFVIAADSLTLHLEEMVTSVVAMSDDTEGLVRVSGDGSENRLMVVMSVLQTIADFLEETNSAHQRTSRNLAEVNTNIQEISVLVGELEFISEEMQLLAINAAIGAAHAQQRGAGLNVIADNIQDVAEDSCRYALVLAGQCKAITDCARQLESFEQEDMARAGDAGKLLNEAQQLMNSLETSHAKLVASAGRVARDTSALTQEVTSIIRGLDISSVFTEKLRPVLSRFKALSASFTEELSAMDDVNLETLFKKLEHCYTMASERQVHKNFVDRQLISSDGPVEQDDDWSRSRQHGLGDNVDLF